jgi:hypothetical protein
LLLLRTTRVAFPRVCFGGGVVIEAAPYTGVWCGSKLGGAAGGAGPAPRARLRLVG